jgi:site-specific recombinase XerD
MLSPNAIFWLALRWGRGAYVDHLEHVMERKHSTIQDYRGHLRRHLVPFFGERPIDKIDPAHVARYLKRKREEGLPSKTVQNHLNFLHGIFSFAIKWGWAQSNPVAHVDRPKKNHSPASACPLLAAGGAGRADRRRA